MKKLLRVLTLAIFLMSLFDVTGSSSAAIVPSYVSIEGTAHVAGPEFYIGAAGSQETLLVNKKSSSCGGSSFGISGTQRAFRTKELGGINFNYLPKINFQVRAKGITMSTSSPVKLGLAFGYYDGEGIPQYLANITVTLSGTMDNYSFPNIVVSKKPSDVHSFFYEFTKICPPDDDSCSVSISKCDGNKVYTGVKITNE